MSSSEAALTALVELLAAAATPEPVVIDDGRIVHTDFSGTLVRPLGLERVGRSRRGGAILDLQLILEVTTHGPHALATMERHLVTIELSQLAAQEQSSPPQRPPGQNSVGTMSLVVVVPVSLSLAEPQPPIVTQPPVVEVHFVSRLDGVLVDTDGHAIAGAIVRMAETGVTSVTDTAGRFRLLNTTDASGSASIDVTVRGHRHATEAQQPVVEDSTAPGLAVVVVDVHGDSHPPSSDIGAEV
jgi:hypothetical protein